VSRRCEVDGEILATTRPDARYCSPRCRKRASRAGNGHQGVLELRESVTAPLETPEPSVTVSGATGAPSALWTELAAAALAANPATADLAAPWAALAQGGGR
jgi:hypothetical protein